jgi:hypothetical protein
MHHCDWLDLSKAGKTGHRLVDFGIWHVKSKKIVKMISLEIQKLKSRYIYFFTIMQSILNDPQGGALEQLAQQYHCQIKQQALSTIISLCSST